VDTWSVVALAGFVLLVVSVANDVAFRRFEADIPRFAAQGPLLRRMNMVARVLALLALALAVVFRLAGLD
jgi:hypothetical protein